jgi:hypothetical protein
MRRSGLVLLLVSAAVLADDTAVEAGGHTKLRLLADWFPGDSLFRDLAGSESVDVEADLRINLAADRGGWSLEAAYQLLALHGDRIDWSRGPGPSEAPVSQRLPGDERRLWDLTHTIRDEGRNALVHRLDRLTAGFASERIVLRFGRQALSWGNGLFYAPMDLVNPFDPAATDTEFKTGDDLFYGQYLRGNGDDVQLAYVFRRDPLSGDVDNDQATSAVKYHGFAGETEFDLLLAESYGDAVAGLGVVRSLGGAVWRGDVVVTDTDTDRAVQVVSNLSYSWVWGGRNVTGAIEYYYNGFGQRDGAYDPASLAGNPDLLQRVARRELYALGRHYLAGSLLVEVSPLWTLTPTLLANLGDPSGLIQLVTRYSLGDNTTFLGSLNLPAGRSGSEFGGIDAGVPGSYLSTGASLFAQIAWYF